MSLQLNLGPNQKNSTGGQYSNRSYQKNSTDSQNSYRSYQKNSTGSQNSNRSYQKNSTGSQNSNRSYQKNSTGSQNSNRSFQKNSNSHKNSNAGRKSWTSHNQELQNNLPNSMNHGEEDGDYVTIDLEDQEEPPPMQIPSNQYGGRILSSSSRRVSIRRGGGPVHNGLGAEDELEKWTQGMGVKGDKVLGVIGSGDYGRAMASRLAQGGYTVLLGARDPNNIQTKQMIADREGVHLVSQSLSAKAAIVLIAVGSDHYNKLPLRQLQGKIVIDVANWTIPRPLDNPSIAESLQEILKQSQVVKAFNVLSAYALENNVVQGGKQVPVASNFTAAKERILALAKELGYTAVDFGDLRRARDIEDIPLQLLTEWRSPALFILILWILQYTILFLKYQICCLITGQTVDTHTLFANLGLLNINRATAITALWSLSLCYLPGAIAAYIQLWRGTKYKRFPKWLDAWLRSRKQLGIIMLFLAAAHTILGASVWSPRYDNLLFESPQVLSVVTGLNESTSMSVAEGTMTWQGELFITAGTISMMVTFILGISSLPSVSATLSWREFTFIQSKLGWLALVSATAHDALLGFGYKEEHYQSCYIASGAQYALHLPLITIIMKIPLILPCIENHLLSIRKGYERNKVRDKKMNENVSVIRDFNDNVGAKGNFRPPPGYSVGDFVPSYHHLYE